MIYTVASGDTLGKIAAKFGVSVSDILTANPSITDPNRIRVGQKLLIPDGTSGSETSSGGSRPTLSRTICGLVDEVSNWFPNYDTEISMVGNFLFGCNFSDAQPIKTTNGTGVTKALTVNTGDALTVPAGQLTFDAEGLDDPDGPYFSRRPHVPSGSSGITIGRGYDMGSKSSEKIKNDLMSAGISEDIAAKFGKGAGKKGDKAKSFIKDNGLTVVTITHEQQKALFAISYEEIQSDVKRICNKADVVEKYGKTNWDKLDSRIKDVLVDLRFRGDYTSTSRVQIQKLVADNNFADFKKKICDKTIWSAVPQDRFNRRCNYVSR